MNKKLVYITVYDLGKGKSSGVVKKILQQIETFSRNEFEVDFFYVNKKTNSLYFVSGGEEILIGTSKWIKGIEYWKLIKGFLQTRVYDAAYVRHTGRIDPWVLSVLKLLKKKSTKVVYEFPTFPYDKLSTLTKGSADLIVDRLFRNQLKKYVDKVATYSKHKYIYGIPTIQVSNGIFVDDVNVIDKVEVKKNTIELIAVAAFHAYHGYDRLIKAIGKYYQEGGKRQILLHLVGEGTVIEEYKKLLKIYNIEKNVIFYGGRYGEELSAIYNKADIAVSVLAAYREDIYYSSALKVREYLSKGLPIITGCEEDIFRKKKEKFVLEFSNDDSEIDIKKIVHFYDDMYGEGNREKLHLQIKEFAKQNVDWSVVLQPIIAFYL